MIFGQVFKKSKVIGGSEMEDKRSDSTESKMSKATNVYQRLIKNEGVQRKDIIQEFIAKCGLTPAGASTYYNTIKKKYRNG